jgi:hypothetical protein
VENFTEGWEATSKTLEKPHLEPLTVRACFGNDRQARAKIREPVGMSTLSPDIGRIHHHASLIKRHKMCIPHNRFTNV